MNEVNFVLLPVLLFLLLLLGTGFYSHRRQKKSQDFQKEYFTASRSLGGIVLAFTLVATYGSVSSFVSGPGVAWDLGLGWVAFAAPQIVTGFLLLGIAGKKLAVLARKTDALTIIDILRARYHSSVLCILLSLVLLVFFTAMVVGQFTGGAQIFAAITGYDYQTGLLVFAMVTVIYTSSGFRAVVLTDAVCAVLMLTGMFILGWCILDEGGGLEGIMQSLSTIRPGPDGQSALFKPDSGGALPYALLFSAWLLVGFCTVGLPQSMVRCLSYRNSADLSQAMVIATIICGALMIGMTLLGVLSRGVIATMPAGGTDAVLPQLIVHYMNPWAAGLTIIGPLAATMSTVSSLLIAAASAVTRDLFLELKGRVKLPVPQRRDAYRLRTTGITLLLGGLAIVLALNPPSIVVWINLFAFGGLESAFMWPLILGLFWSRMNARGALWGIVMGLGLYTLAIATGFSFRGWHNILIGTAAGLLFSILGACTGKSTSEQTLRLFFPEKF